MTNQQAAIILKKFYNQIHTDRGSIKSDFEFNFDKFDIVESLVKAINLLEQTPDAPINESKFQIGEKVMSVSNPEYGVGTVNIVTKGIFGYYYSVNFKPDIVCSGVAEKNLRCVN